MNLALHHGLKKTKIDYDFDVFVNKILLIFHYSIIIPYNNSPSSLNFSGQ